MKAAMPIIGPILSLRLINLFRSEMIIAIGKKYKHTYAIPKINKADIRVINISLYF